MLEFVNVVGLVLRLLGSESLHAGLGLSSTPWGYGVGEAQGARD